MGVLLLRLAGPMQSWGTQSRFEIRDTGTEPSKSGVVGLLCAALGRSREKPVDDLAALRMGVRVDHEGTRRVDYQTAGGTHRPGDRYGVALVEGGTRTVTSSRYYLAGADFLVALQGSGALLAELDSALTCPAWQLYLGRKSFVPGCPVRIPDGLTGGDDLASALRAYPWPRPGTPVPPPQQRPDRLRVILETGLDDGTEVRHDQPVGAAFLARTFIPRGLSVDFLNLGLDVPVREE